MINKVKKYIKKFFKGEEGMGVIEVVLIIVVLVGLALLFKTQITATAQMILKTINVRVKSF